MDHVDYVARVLEYCRKREDNLRNGESVGKYNLYFDRMRKYARKLIDENGQEALLPYLENESISVRSDLAGLLFHCYPEQCTQVLQEIAAMTLQNGLPKCFIRVVVTARDTLKYGVHRNFP